MKVLIKDSEGFINTWNIRAENDSIFHLELKNDKSTITAISKNSCKKTNDDDTLKTEEIRNLYLRRKKKVGRKNKVK